MANLARKSFVIEVSRSTAQVCRKPWDRSYLGQCLSARLFLLVSTLNAATGGRNFVYRLERLWGPWAKQTPGIGAFGGLVRRQLSHYFFFFISAHPFLCHKSSSKFVN